MVLQWQQPGMERRYCTQAMDSSQLDRTPPGFDVSCSSVPLRPPNHHSLEAILLLLLALRTVPGRGLPRFLPPITPVLPPNADFHIGQLAHPSTLCRLIHFSAFPWAVFLRGFFPEFILFLCCRASLSYSLYNNVGGDNHVVTYSIDKRLWLVHKAGDVGGK